MQENNYKMGLLTISVATILSFWVISYDADALDMVRVVCEILISIIYTILYGINEFLEFFYMLILYAVGDCAWVNKMVEFIFIKNGHN